MSERVHVLFMQSQAGFGADSAIHAQLMRYLDRERFALHVACPEDSDGRAPPSLLALRKIPGLELRPTRFAPSVRGRGVREVAQSLLRASAFPADFLALARYARERKIRLIHSTERPRDAVYNLALSRLIGARSVVHVHVKWSEEYSAPARFGVRHADGVFSISRYVTDTIVKMGTPAERVHTVLNGIDAAVWDPALDGGALRREFSVPADALVFCSVSRLFSWKGQRELIKAFASIRGELPNAKLMIVGADAVEVEGNSFSAELRQLAQALGVAEHVIFTGARNDIPSILAACDVFSMPSFEEPFGLVFLEAMAMRRPVVAIDNGGTPEVVEHERSGLLSPAWDIPALAHNMLRLARDPELRSRFGDYGRRQVLERFTSQRMARDAGEAYLRILAGSSAI